MMYAIGKGWGYGDRRGGGEGRGGGYDDGEGHGDGNGYGYDGGGGYGDGYDSGGDGNGGGNGRDDGDNGMENPNITCLYITGIGPLQSLVCQQKLMGCLA